MKGIRLLFLFLAFVGARAATVPVYEDIQDAIPAHLDLDPDLQQRLRNLFHRNEDGRIVGGNESIPNSRPYQVGLFIPIDNQTSFCGGSLINARTVLTAAHCMDRRTGNITVHLGAHNMPPTAAETRVVTMSSNDVVIHPQWNRSILLNDVAIIRFHASVALSEVISPILLPRDANQDYLGNTSLVSGWGRNSDSATGISPVLREVSFPVISNYACRLAFLGTIEDSHICTSGAFGRSACHGDSGGPLINNGVLIGVVSFGTGYGCEHGYPPVFARVTYYLNWIQQNSAVVT